MKSLQTTSHVSKRLSNRGLVRELAKQAHVFREQLSFELRGRSDRQLMAAHGSLTESLAREVTADECADVLAQAVVCAAPILAMRTECNRQVIPWLREQFSAWERFVLKRSLSPPLLLSRSPPLSACHLYDTFLHHYRRGDRKRGGVFFTPQPIADFIVAEIDDLLREEFGLADGLSDSRPFILDPAAGTGIFLLAALDRMHGALIARGRQAWNAFVKELLPRLWGIEILPAAALLAKLNLALKLAETGYGFEGPGQINIILGDALAPAINAQVLNLKSKIQNLKSPLPVILGNPPFSSLSTNTNEWIARLVRGDEEVRGYVRANGERLNERKTWLHDDYVKFIRLAQWHVEEAGAGIVGFVTNHGFLDNATFRLMRQELLRVFSRLRIVDLHGNRKKCEESPDGSPDGNVFGLDQGVAIALLAKSASERNAAASHRSRVEYGEIWGSRESKMQALSTAQHGLPSLITPTAPEWRLVPTADRKSFPEYERAWSLADVMPVNTTAPVTARDKFVVAFTEEELEQRIAEFRDLSISDEEIRRRYFTRTRSARHQRGDTRGWKLSEARRIVAADGDWRRHIIRCLYRPFDWRFVFWHPAMIDWPRTEVTRHLLPNSEFRMQNSEFCERAADNSAFCILNSALCLIARRQQLPTQPCTFFWIADGLALDGVIRSDNRGSESLFPLYLREAGVGGQASWRANFAPAFIADVSKHIQLAWLPMGSGDLERTFGPDDLLAYIHALFHAPSYRERYAAALRDDFPRVLLPGGTEQFRKMCSLGSELMDLHVAGKRDGTEYSVLSTQRSTSVIDDPEVTSFRVGGYPVLKKWLQPPQRSPADPEFRQICRTIECTIELMKRVDESMVAHGGFANRLSPP